MLHDFARCCYIELNDLEHLTRIGTLEIYHALFIKCALESLYFSYFGNLMKSLLAVLDFNSGSGLEQARTKSTMMSLKPIKVKKDNYHLKEMVQETIEYAASKSTHSIPVIPSLTENIANVQKPNKEEIAKN